MNKKQLVKFKAQLEDMRNEIISDVEQTLSDMTSQNGNIPDPNDRATVESDRNFELRIRDAGNSIDGSFAQPGSQTEYLVSLDTVTANFQGRHYRVPP